MKTLPSGIDAHSAGPTSLLFRNPHLLQPQDPLRRRRWLLRVHRPLLLRWSLRLSLLWVLHVHLPRPAGDVIRPIALFGGAKFEDPDSYQSQDLNWLCSSDAAGLSDDRLIQRYSLASIYYATFNVSTSFTDIAFGRGFVFPWAVSGTWLSDDNECTWGRQLMCDANNFVIFLDLFSNLITGEFPPEVVLLKSTLQVLDLGTNQVFTDGAIFNPFLGELTELLDLRYDDTNFQNNQGVPSQIGNLKKLGFYNAGRTLYRGPLNGAAFPSDLLDLYWIELEFNSFNSSIPLEIGQLPNLTDFFIRDSFIEGDLEYLRAASKIRTNWVDINPGLAGPLPTFLGSLSTLGSLSLTDCSFTGTLPTEIGLLRNSLSSCIFLTLVVPDHHRAVAHSISNHVIH